MRKGNAFKFVKTLYVTFSPLGGKFLARMVTVKVKGTRQK